jgi:inner membrane protein
MSPITHLLTSWAIANSTGLARRDRALVTLAGVVPDIDGLGVIAEIATKNSTNALYWWSNYHHVLCHNIGFGLFLLVAVVLLSVRRWKTAALALLVFHLHVLGDIVGARGPDGNQWPIAYLLPFSNRWQLTWEGQWALNAWPNMLITALVLAVTLYLTWKRGHSPLEMVSKRADSVFVATLRRRFGGPGESHE